MKDVQLQFPPEILKGANEFITVIDDICQLRGKSALVHGACDTLCRGVFVSDNLVAAINADRPQMGVVPNNSITDIRKALKAKGVVFHQYTCAQGCLAHKKRRRCGKKEGEEAKHQVTLKNRGGEKQPKKKKTKDKAKGVKIEEGESSSNSSSISSISSISSSGGGGERSSSSSGFGVDGSFGGTSTLLPKPPSSSQI